jgi:hypothetical protein
MISRWLLHLQHHIYVRGRKKGGRPENKRVKKEKKA